MSFITNYHDETPITDCKEFGQYISVNIFQNNWKSLKETVNINKKIWSKRCKGCKKKKNETGKQ